MLKNQIQIKSDSDKSALLLELERLKADLDNNQKKNDSIKGDLQVLTNKQVELETNLDAILRDKRQSEQERSNINDELSKS